MGQVFLSPGAVSPPPDVLRSVEGLHFLWHAWDGMTWDIGAVDGSSGVTLAAGVRGLDFPQIDWHTSESASVDGAQDRSWRIPARDVFWPLRIWQDAKSQEWLDYDAAFWRTMQPGRYGTWEVQQPSGVARTLRLRIQDPGDWEMGTDPALLGWAKYGRRLTAPDPYWRGDPIVRSWTTATGSDFFGGVAKAPPFIISPASTVSTATLTNPGDVPAWPVWTVYGPATAATLGIVGQTVSVPFAVASGKALVVDTDPRAQTAYLYDVSGGELVNPVERTGDLGAVGFAAIPPGESVTLSLALTGSGTIQCRLVPGWLRAW